MSCCPRFVGWGASPTRNAPGRLGVSQSLPNRDCRRERIGWFCVVQVFMPRFAGRRAPLSSPCRSVERSRARPSKGFKPKSFRHARGPGHECLGYGKKRGCSPDLAVARTSGKPCSRKMPWASSSPAQGIVVSRNARPISSGTRWGSQSLASPYDSSRQTPCSCPGRCRRTRRRSGPIRSAGRPQSYRPRWNCRPTGLRSRCCR